MGKNTFFASCVIYDMIFIYCKWIFTWWQWRVNLYKNMKETAINERRNNTQNSTKTQDTQNRNQTYTTRNQTYKTRKQS